MKETFCLRPARYSDLDDLLSLAQQAEYGLTSLPKDRYAFRERLLLSVESFQRYVGTPGDEIYIFVLESLVSKKVVGTCNILASIGFKDPFFFYQLHSFLKESSAQGISQHIDVLEPISIQKGSSEIGGLYLHPDYRGKGVGRFLSLGRFMFMATHLRRFKESVIAEMRGVSDASGYSPFWAHVGQRYLGVSFKEADLYSIQDPLFIKNCFPQVPVCVNLLDASAQEVIGRAHQNTVPALRLLLSEGFDMTDCVDLFDAGPKIRAHCSSIRVMKDSKRAIVSGIEANSLSKERYLVSAGNLSSFRVCCGPLQEDSKGGVSLPSDLALLLDVEPGQSVNYASLLPQQAPSQVIKDVVDLRGATPLVKRSQSFIRRFSEWYKKVSILSKIDG